MKPLSIYAPGQWDIYDSYGLIACEMARHAEALGYHVNAFGRAATILDNQPPDVKMITQRPIIPTYGGIVLGYPTTYAQHPVFLDMGRRVAVTMFESTKIPAEWVDPLNECDAVVVPSRWLVNVFASAGVTAPIHRIPLGIGDAYQPRPRDRSNRPYTFLAFLDRGKRKGGHFAVFAFIQAFGDRDDVKLVLKTRDRELTGSLSNQNIVTIAQDMTPEELADLYGQCDCLINPNMGEGFGLIPREFAATGGLALATDWGGTADDLMEWGVGIPYDLVAADWSMSKKFAGRDLGVWAMPNVQALAYLLRDIVAQPDHWAKVAMQRAPAVRRLYSWGQFVARMMGIWEGINHADPIRL